MRNETKNTNSNQDIIDEINIIKEDIKDVHYAMQYESGDELANSFRMLRELNQYVDELKSKLGETK